jgi:thiopurine S-methyltransferase
MDAQFWLERWKKNDIGFHQQEINIHLQKYWDKLNLNARQAVFVPLCGKSRDMLWLRSRGHEVLGVEISPIAVRDFYAENGLEPVVTNYGPFTRWEFDRLVIYVGDFFNIGAKMLRHVAGVYDRASLIAFPQATRPRYAAHLQACLPTAAEILLVTMQYPVNEMQGPPFSVDAAEVMALFRNRYDITRLCEIDILDENPRFRARGLSALLERVYHLKP